MTSFTGPIEIAAAVLLIAGLLWPRHGALAQLARRRTAQRRALYEDVLKHMLAWERRGKTATPESVAGALGLGPKRVLDLITHMEARNLLRSGADGLSLTAQGERLALHVVRAHRLWERYLADETGVDPVEWHTRAEKQEHALSLEDANALAERLGNPRFDPHGDPIPAADGSVIGETPVPLTVLEPGERAVVTHLEDEPPVVFAQIVALGIYVGMEVRMEARAEQRIVFDAEGRHVVLAPLIAANISIRKLDKEEAARESTATLAELHLGQQADVVRVSPACRGLERRRLMDLGIVAGTRVAYERRGLTGGLSAYRVRGTVIALREEQARMIGITNIATTANDEPVENMEAS
jgi:DtxR family Mn-dependent transcriptional regulator